MSTQIFAHSVTKSAHLILKYLLLQLLKYELVQNWIFMYQKSKYFKIILLQDNKLKMNVVIQISE